MNRPAASSRTFAYLGVFTWRRVARWLRKKHPRASWKQLRRRYSSGWTPAEDGGRALLPEPRDDHAVPVPRSPRPHALVVSRVPG